MQYKYNNNIFFYEINKTLINISKSDKLVWCQEYDYVVEIHLKAIWY